MKIEDWEEFYQGFVRRPPGTWWPIGEVNGAANHLQPILARAARDHALRTLATFAGDDRADLLVAAVGAGSSVELLAKAYLASVSPALLADRGDRDAVLVLTDLEHRADRSATEIKTITAREAMLRCRHLITSFPHNPQRDERLWQVRNAAIHLGVVSREELLEGVGLMCVISDALLEALDLDRDGYWLGSALGVVDALNDQSRARHAQLAAAKMAAARDRVRKLLEGLDAPGRAAIVATRGGLRRTVSDHAVSWACPVCGSPAWLICGVERGEVETYQESDGTVTAFVSQTAYAHTFECSLCGLELEYGELEEAGLPLEVEMEDDHDPWELFDVE